MNFAQSALARTQQFVADHKVGIAITGTAVVTATITAAVFIKAKNLTISQIDGFLDDKGLLEEFQNYLTEKNF